MEPAKTNPPGVAYVVGAADGSIRPRKTLYVVLLFIFTGTYYSVIWLDRTTRDLNRRFPEHRISPLFTGTAHAMALLSLAWSLFEIFGTFQFPLEDLVKRVNSVYIWLLMAWTLRVRDRLNLLFRHYPKEKSWIRVVWTWILGIIYLQAKINSSLAAEPDHLSGYGRPWPWKKYKLGRLGWSLALVWVLPLAFLFLLPLFVQGALWSGELLYHRAQLRIEERLGPLERLADTRRPELVWSISELATKLQLTEADGEFLTQVVKDCSQVSAQHSGPRLNELVTRNEEALEELTVLLAEPMEWRIQDLTHDRALPPDGYPLVGQLNRLIYVRALLSEGSDREPAFGLAMFQLGRLAEAAYADPNGVTHVLGQHAETLQLRLLERACGQTQCSGSFATAVRPYLLDLESREMLRTALAVEALAVPGVLAGAIARLPDPTDHNFYEVIGKNSGKAMAYHASAGAYDVLLMYDDSWQWSNEEISTKLDWKSEDLSFYDKIRWIGAFDLWWLPARYRMFDDSRRIGQLYLDLLAHVNDTGSCTGMIVNQRLAPLVEIIEWPEGGGCWIDYIPGEGYDRLIGKGKGLNPPFHWSLMFSPTAQMNSGAE
ncbi:MAG: hypothetical protein K8J08_18555 [Thermoanaerobaculia bacterium]|nr:hypothetical protein [Thermoanaerobaculia bacterium]